MSLPKTRFKNNIMLTPNGIEIYNIHSKIKEVNYDY